ncbi:hypothetical protein GCM10009803_16860 [Microbacterium ginsengiterrae]
MLGAAVVLVLALTGCGIQVPADPHGTTERVEGGVLRVGVTDNPPWVVLDGPGDPAGTEVDLVSGFAGRLDAEVEWTEGSEARLLQDLERGRIDMVVGGFLDDTPWSDRGGMTRVYTEVSGEDGPEKHVMIVRMGENRLLSTLESYLLEEVGS